jgi:outer membrane receptor protein involved in Fe transport
VELDLLTRELVHETAADSLAEMGLSSDRLTNSYFLPRAQAHFRPSAKLVLGLSAGRGIVGPTPVFEKTCCGAAYKRSIELVPERAWSYQGTVEWHPTLDMRLTTTLFWTDFTNYQERAVDQSAVNLYVPKYQNKNIPTARVRGMDVVHDMRFRDDVYNVGWTYTYSDPEDDHGKPLRFLSRHEASAYFRYNEREHGTSVSLDVRYVGPQSHYLLTETRLPADSPPEYVDSDGYVTADVRVEQRLGKKGWSVFGGASNLTDYVQSDLGEFWRCYDWGPLQGRYAFVGAKLNR